MPRIHVLSAQVRGKIAAGEVITRPASVIKELLENSLDARSSRVEIEIANGGKDKCLVNDDGEGMAREDAQLALHRYATS
ncbi:MAG: ATP-binding protein, partial [candidate division WOR-3 bacterium]